MRCIPGVFILHKPLSNNQSLKLTCKTHTNLENICEKIIDTQTRNLYGINLFLVISNDKNLFKYLYPVRNVSSEIRPLLYIYYSQGVLFFLPSLFPYFMTHS